MRAKIILMAAQGLPNDVIGLRLDMPRQIVSKWRKRFYEHGFPGSSKRNLVAGLPPAFPPSVVVAVKALVCELPHRSGLPLSRWSLADIEREVVGEGIVAQISGSTLWRWLSREALCPWRYRSWIFPRDPQLRRQGRPGA